jgi:hypothetical protein
VAIFSQKPDPPSSFFPVFAEKEDIHFTAKGVERGGHPKSSGTKNPP